MSGVGLSARIHKATALLLKSQLLAERLYLEKIVANGPQILALEVGKQVLKEFKHLNPLLICLDKALMLRSNMLAIIQFKRTLNNCMKI